MPPIFRVLGGVGGAVPPPPFSASLVGIAPTPLEIGADLVNPTFNALYVNGPPTFAELSDDVPFLPQNVVGAINPITRPFTYQQVANGATQVFTLTADVGGPSSIDTVTYTWLPRVFWGLTLVAGGYTEAQIEGLGNSALASSKARVFTLSPVAQYIVYAWPASFGNANPLDFQIGPFPGGFVEAAGSPLLITANTPGAPAQLYRIWRSTNLLTGTPTVTVTVS